MLGIVDRYLLREVTKAFLAIILVLILIVSSLMFLRTLEEVNIGGLGAGVVFDYLRLQLVRDTSSLLPPAFFLALLVTLSRLSSGSELIAMNACGIGPPRIYRNLVLLAIPVSLATAWFSLVLQPQAAAGIQEIRLQQKAQAAQVAGLQAGRFYVEEEGNVVVYIGEIDRRRSLSDVFVLDRRGSKTRLVVSQGGQHHVEDATGDHLVTLSQGHRFDGVAGSSEYLIADFDEYEIRIPGSGPTGRAFSKRSTKPTAALVESADIGDKVELQHRMAGPLAIFTLAVMAVPLVDISPRQRASGRLLLALLAYFSFFNLQRLAESWMETAVTPLWLSSLWYQVLILAVVHLLASSDGFWMRRFGRRLRRARTLEATQAA